jgi:hypothetical protein
MEQLISPARLRYVTARYPQLQGGRLVPLSFVFLASASWRAGGLHLPGDATAHGAEVWFFGAIAVAIAASYLIRRWYGRKFGAVGQHVTRNAALPILGTCVLLVLAAYLQQTLAWHLSLPTVAVAVVLLGIGTAHSSFRGHYVAAAAVLLAFAALPMLNVGGRGMDAALDAAIGFALLIVGLGDHLLLMRTFYRDPRRLA